MLKPNKGPPNCFARASALADYNGERGGEVFLWYHKARFERELHALETTVEHASEAQVMIALKKTSESLHGGIVNGRPLQEYAGPQCFPQVQERLNACLLYTSPSPRDRTRSRMPSSA